MDGSRSLGLSLGGMAWPGLQSHCADGELIGFHSSGPQLQHAGLSSTTKQTAVYLFEHAGRFGSAGFVIYCTPQCGRPVSHVYLMHSITDDHAGCVVQERSLKQSALEVEISKTLPRKNQGVEMFL